MKKRKIILSVSIVTVFVLLIYITDMVRNWENFENNTEGEETKETVSLEWYINYSWFDTTWGESMVSREITKITGVDIDFVIPKGNEADKISSMIEMDTLPDLVTVGWWGTEGREMIAGKIGRAHV